jgi:hypothetical protein
MPYEHIWEPDGVVRRFWGHVTSAEIAGSAEHVEADCRFDDLHYVINDFSDCISVDMPDAIIEEIAAKDGAAANSNSRIRIAVVSDHPDVLQIADAYMAQSLSPYVAKNFGSMEAARTWVSVP